MPKQREELAALLDLSGRCAIVTGAAQGFGAAIAARIAEAGATVIIADTNGEAATSHATSLADSGLRAAAYQVDITDMDAVESMVHQARMHTGRIDLLVNNAGVFSNYLIENMPPAEFERILSVNVQGAFYCTQATVRAMLTDGRGGAVVNVASVDALSASAEGLSHYTTSKHAIAGLTRSLAMELAPRGIRVNAVCPGAAMTDGATALVTAGAPSGIDVVAQWDGIKELTPLGRLCEPDDVALAVLFLASEMAAFVTGVLLPVDGGILIRPLEGYLPKSGAQQ